MIITPEHIIKKYFPEPIETTRELYERLDFDESVYPYSKWIDDAKYCLSQYLDESQYTLIPDSEEKNFRITQRHFGYSWKVVLKNRRRNQGQFCRNFGRGLPKTPAFEKIAGSVGSGDGIRKSGAQGVQKTKGQIQPIRAGCF